MALKTCTRPAGSVGAYARIEIRLSQDTIITSGGLNYLASPIEVTAAGDGSYTVQLQANADLTPTGTYYTVSEFAGTTDQTYYIQVPSSAGPFVITTIQVSPLPTVAATPTHVSTLTVDGGAGSPTITNGDIAARSLTVASGSGPYSADSEAQSNSGISTLFLNRELWLPRSNGTDDTSVIQTTINTAKAWGAPIKGQAGQNYLISSPLKCDLSAASTSVPGVSFLGEGSGMDKFSSGREAITKFTALGTFPVGEYLLDWIGPQNGGGFSAMFGFSFGGFALECQSRAAGIRVINEVQFKASQIVINEGATPAPANNNGSPTGAFAMVKSAAVPYAYQNLIDQIYVIAAAKDGIQLTEGAGSFVVARACSSIGSGRYGYVVGDAAECANCDAQSSITADYYLNGGILTDCTELFATKGNSIIVDNTFGNSTRQSQINGGQFRGTGQGSLSEANSALIHIIGFPMHLTVVGSGFIAGSTTSNWLYNDAGVTGAVSFLVCDFNPSPAPTTHLFNLNGSTAVTKFVNCPGINPLGTGVTTPAVSTPLTNTTGVDVYVSFIANAAGTTFTVNGKALGATPANAQSGFFWPAGTVMSYVNAPASWAWIGL